MKLICSQEWYLREMGLFTLAEYASEWWNKLV